MTGNGSDVNDTEQTCKRTGMFYRKTTVRSKVSKFTSTPSPSPQRTSRSNYRVFIKCETWHVVYIY